MDLSCTAFVREVARLAGRATYAFDCSSSLTAASLAALLRGLSHSGAWLTFNGVNRLSHDLQSVLTELACAALASLSEEGAEDGGALVTTLDTDATCANDVAYVERPLVLSQTSALPVKTLDLFRFVSVRPPDPVLYAESRLLVEGFHGAAALAKQLVVLLTTALELLGSIVDARCEFRF